MTQLLPRAGLRGQREGHQARTEFLSETQRSALCAGALAPSRERGVCPPGGAGRSLSTAARSLPALEPLPKGGIQGLSALSLGK